MITTAEFKKQVAKPFGQEMRRYGFKGNGFDYFQETDRYLIGVYITPGRWGGNCTAGFAIHPKQIVENSQGKIDFEKLKFHQYEFRMGLTKNPRGEWWDYADDETANLETLAKIIHSINGKAFPIIEQFKATPSILERFEVSEMDEFHENWEAKTGVSIATIEVRFAWAIAVIFEHQDPTKAKEFAHWAVSKATGSIDWFGDKDLRRILTKKASA
jgi:hypothetical protein